MARLTIKEGNEASRNSSYQIGFGNKGNWRRSLSHVFEEKEKIVLVPAKTSSIKKIVSGDSE